jgi:tRNA G37 N-methylase Trm5
MKIVGDTLLFKKEEEQKVKKLISVNRLTYSLIKKSIVNCQLKKIKVIYRISKVRGKNRIRSYKRIFLDPNREGGLSPSEVLFKENNYRFLIDLKKVYFDSSYSNEKNRLSTQLNGEEIDILYGGAGFFGVYLSKNFNKINIIDHNSCCREYLDKNNHLNSIKNLSFINSTVEAYLLNKNERKGIMLAVNPLNEKMYPFYFEKYKKVYFYKLLNDLEIPLFCKKLTLIGYNINYYKKIKKYSYDSTIYYFDLSSSD